jgi:cobalt-zinc-cadmium efflux system outer membrane protein
MRTKRLSTACALAALALAGCSYPAWDEPEFPAVAGTTGRDDARAPDAGPSAPTGSAGPIALETAKGLALEYNHGLRGHEHAVNSARARSRQAAYRPRPELQIELEEFGGTGALRGVGAMSTVVAIGRQIERGSKLRLRADHARAELRIASSDAAGARVALLAGVERAFVEVLSGQRRTELAREGVLEAEQTHAAVAARVGAGKAPEQHRIRAEAEFALARLALARTERDLAAARRRLAATWGAAEASFARAEGDLEALLPEPDIASLTARIAVSPSVVAAEAELAAARARHGLERANAASDANIGAGLQHFAETGESALVFSLSIPLGMFDRNQGNIASALAEVEAARERLEQRRLDVRTGLLGAHDALRSARDEVVALRDVVLPAAQRAFDAAQEGYREGRFGSLEVLDAQAGLTGARAQLVDAMESYWSANADLAELTAADGHGASDGIERGN